MPTTSSTLSSATKTVQDGLSDDVPAELLLRPVGNFERYSLTRTLCDERVLISYAARHRSTVPSDLHAHLSRRIAFLLSRLPMLSCSVANYKTNRPLFRLPDEPIDVSSILSTVRLAADDFDEDRVVPRQLNDTQIDIAKAPLWSVVLYTTGDKDATQEQEVIVGLVIHHILADGRGSANLFCALLAENEPDDALIGGSLPQSTAEAPPTRLLTKDLPPTEEEVYQMKPALSYLLPVAWAQLIVPKIPSAWLRARLGPAPSWPSHKALPFVPQTRPPVHRFIRLQDDTTTAAAKGGILSAFKARGQEHGVKTIQSTLQSAALVALWCVLQDDERRKGVKVGTATPLSMRKVDEDVRQTAYVGNYVASLELASFVRPTNSFWAYARDYGQKVVDPKVRRDALWLIGMLAHIPQASFETFPTSWEKYFKHKIASDTPYRSSFGLSNLGLMRLPGGWEGGGWAQMPSSVGNAFTVDVCGVEVGEGGGKRTSLSICVSWREGVVPGQAFVEALEQTLRLVVERGFEEDTTVEQASRAVRKALKEGREK